MIAGKRSLLLHGNQVHAFSSEEVLNDFISWVSDLPKFNVLVAHSGDKFGYPILYAHLQNASRLETFTSHVFGSVDTNKKAHRSLERSPEE